MPNLSLPEDASTWRAWLHDLLKTDTYDITFTKVDGTERTMTCTLNPDNIPLMENKNTTAKENLSILRVFSVDRGEWRSFRVANVLGVSKNG